MQDRPTAVELLDAIREFLAEDVMPAVEGRVQFHTRVAINALGMLERELRLGFDRRVVQHLKAPRLLHGVIEQQRLADPGAAAENERAAPAKARFC